MIKQLLWIATVTAWLSGCGGRPTIPVEEHSSVKRPPVKEVYYRAAPAVKRPAVVVQERQEPITYEAVEPEPVWQEIPPPKEPARTNPAPRTVQREATQTVTGDDPLLSMLQKIEQAMQQGEYQRAEGLLERALRIDSKRSGLWHDLAQVRYHQQSYREAVTLARRSNSFAGSAVLKEENWSLIARSKEALGDLDGARAAWRKAGR